MERCAALIKLLNMRSDSYWFQEPVPVDEVPDYLDIVPEPMDYTTASAKLKAGEYTDDHFAFAADMRKIYTNAVKYNWSPDHPCNIAARAGLREFELLFSRVTGANSNSVSAPEHVKPSKKRKHQSLGAR